MLTVRDYSQMTGAHPSKYRVQSHGSCMSLSNVREQFLNEALQVVIIMLVSGQVALTRLDETRKRRKRSSSCAQHFENDSKR